MLASNSDSKKNLSNSNLEDMKTLRQKDIELISSSSEDEKGFNKNPFRNNRSNVSLNNLRSMEDLKEEMVKQRAEGKRGLLLLPPKDAKASKSVIKKNTLGIFDREVYIDDEEIRRRDMEVMRKNNPDAYTMISKQNER